jgi:hypothetical protein
MPQKRQSIERVGCHIRYCTTAEHAGYRLSKTYLKIITASILNRQWMIVRASSKILLRGGFPFGGEKMPSGFDYDTGIILAMTVTSCFLISIVWRLYSASKDRDRPFDRN